MLFSYSHPAEGTSPGKRVENKIRVPVRYCMLGSRDSARSDMSHACYTASSPQFMSSSKRGAGKNG